MENMFSECKNLKYINFGQNFNTTKDTNMKNMFSRCDNLHKDIKNKFSSKNE